MEKMNEAVGMKNCFTVDGGGKWLVHPFNRKEFWKLIGCILLSVTYGKKGHKLWREIPKYSGKMAPTKIIRCVSGNTNLYKVCCAHYHHFLSMLAIELMFLLVLTSLFLLQVFCIYLTRYKEFRTFWPSESVDPLVKGTDNF